MKGGDFNVTEDQFVPVLFDKYFGTEKTFTSRYNNDESPCKTL